jgi:hypothetical protein
MKRWKEEAKLEASGIRTRFRSRSDEVRVKKQKAWKRTNI